jgi:nitric oxide synthase oxygenase domain/subunit
LKGFSNKDKLLDTQNEIKDRARRIKESTKKICRLFKDNKNVSDTEKVKKDMEFIKGLFTTLHTDLSGNNSFQMFNDEVLSNLEEQDALRNKQQYEKLLTKQIKELKQKYNQVIIEFNTETEDT